MLLLHPFDIVLDIMSLDRKEVFINPKSIKFRKLLVIIGEYLCGDEEISRIFTIVPLLTFSSPERILAIFDGFIEIALANVM